MNEINQARLFIQKNKPSEVSAINELCPEPVLKMIADFIGWVWSDDQAITDYDMKELRKLIRDWNFLSDSVVAQIESLQDAHNGHFGVHICSNSCTIQATRFRSPMDNPPHYLIEVVESTKKLSTLKAAIIFIRWWNDRNQYKAPNEQP